MIKFFVKHHQEGLGAALRFLDDWISGCHGKVKLAWT